MVTDFKYLERFKKANFIKKPFGIKKLPDDQKPINRFCHHCKRHGGPLLRFHARDRIL